MGLVCCPDDLIGKLVPSRAGLIVGRGMAGTSRSSHAGQSALACYY
jgi:hypothetical protein